MIWIIIFVYVLRVKCLLAFLYYIIVVEAFPVLISLSWETDAFCRIGTGVLIFGSVCKYLCLRKLFRSLQFCGVLVLLSISKSVHTNKYKCSQVTTYLNMINLPVITLDNNGYRRGGTTFVFWKCILERRMCNSLQPLSGSVFTWRMILAIISTSAPKIPCSYMNWVL